MRFPIQASRAIAAAVVFVVSACSGGGGGGGDPPPKQELKLVMSGVVVTPENVSPDKASVQVTVGEEAFATETDDEGRYTVELSVDPDLKDELVSILTTLGTKIGAGNAEIEMLSRVGSFDALQGAAGTDGELTADENLRVNVSNLTTAEAVLLDEPKRIGKAFAFGDGVDPTEALDLAAALEVAATDPQEFPLPEGVASTLALARDRQKRESFIETIEEQEPQKLEQARVRLVSNPDIVGTVSASEVPEELFAAALQVDGSYPLNYFTLVDGFEFDAEGQGLYFNAQKSAATTWSVDGSRIVVAYDQAVVTVGFPLVDCNGTGELTQRETKTSENGVDLVLLSPTAASLTRTYTVTTPGCPNVPARSETATEAKTLLNAETTARFTAADFAGRSFAIPVLPLADDGDFDRFKDDVLGFQPGDAGSGSGQFYIGNFEWVFDDEFGAIDLAYGGIDGRYGRVPAQGVDSAGVAQAVLTEFSSDSGRYVDVQLMFALDPQFQFEQAGIPGRYALFGNAGFSLRFDADGRGAQEDGSDPDDPYAKFRWSLENSGAIAVRRYFDEADGSFDCDPQVQSCILFDERLLVPVNRAGERYYWLERRRFSMSGVGPTTPQSSMARYYDREDLQALSGKRSVERRAGSRRIAATRAQQ